MNISHIKKSNRKQKSSGFSLIELMVSLTVFSITMVISIGTLLIFIDLNAKAQALYSSTTNISFMLDSMTRDIRTGYHYYCALNPTSTGFPNATETRDCANGNYITFFREQDDARRAYKLVTTNGRGEIQQYIVGTGWVKATSDDINVTSFVLTVVNSSPNGGGSEVKQPVVTITIKGELSNGLDTPTQFNIQTRIVERRLDLI